MSCLYPKARMLASRRLVMFQHFFIRVSPSWSTVPFSAFRMYVIIFGFCSGRSGTALTCFTSCSAVIASSCSRNSRLGLLGIHRPLYLIQNRVPGGGGIWVVHRVAERAS